MHFKLVNFDYSQVISGNTGTYDYQYAYTMYSNVATTYSFVGGSVVNTASGYLYAAVLMGSSRDVGMVYTNVRWTGGNAPFTQTRYCRY